MSSTGAAAARRPRYQSQASNASSALSQSLSNAEAVNLNESYSASVASLTPLVTIIYSTASLSKDNQQLLLNSYSSCRRLLEHLKPIVGVPFDDMIDLMDNEGKLKELNTHADDYASQYLSARHTYYVLKIEMDHALGEKRYIPNFNLEQIDQKLMTIFTNSLNALNKSKRGVGKPKANAAGQSSSNAAQAKAKRVSSRK